MSVGNDASVGAGAGNKARPKAEEINMSPTLGGNNKPYCGGVQEGRPVLRWHKLAASH